MDDARIEAALLALAEARRAGSFCPSEAARRLAEGSGAGWRPLMPEIRRVAARLAREGRLVALQGGAPVDALGARGPIRLAAPRRSGLPGPEGRPPLA